MAYVIFKTEDNANNVRNIIKDDTVLAETFVSSSESKKTISSADFNSVNLGRKEITGFSGDTVLFSTHASDKEFASSADDLKNQIKINIEVLERFASNRPTSSLTSDVNATVSALRSLDTSSITYPMTQTLEEKLASDNSDLNVISLLQIF